MLKDLCTDIIHNLVEELDELESEKSMIEELLEPIDGKIEEKTKELHHYKKELQKLEA